MMMGKSDRLVFPEYLNVLNECNNDSIKSVAFLGFPKENDFTLHVNGKIRHFYDLSLKNWDINSNWKLKQNYDLIVCTRCAYFSSDPTTFIQRCKNHLNDDSLALIDWGLGDHWRFDKYKVGWIRYGEREYAYHPKNYLYSCFWNKELANDPNVKNFWEAVRNNSRFGYHQSDDISSVVKLEVPTLINYPIQKIKTKFLWPDNPQLYIITLLRKN